MKQKKASTLHGMIRVSPGLYRTPNGRIQMHLVKKTTGGWGRPSRSLLWYTFEAVEPDEHIRIEIGPTYECVHEGHEAAARCAMNLAERADEVVARYRDLHEAQRGEGLYNGAYKAAILRHSDRLADIATGRAGPERFVYGVEGRSAGTRARRA